MIIDLILNGFAAVGVITATGSLTLVTAIKNSKPDELRFKNVDRGASFQKYDRRARNLELASKIRTIIQTDPNSKKSV
jgi:hypothetical protein